MGQPPTFRDRAGGRPPTSRPLKTLLGTRHALTSVCPIVTVEYDLAWVLNSYP